MYRVGGFYILFLPYMGIHSIVYFFYKNAHNFGLDQYFWMKFSGSLNDN